MRNQASIVALLVAILAPLVASAEVTVDELRCEYLTDPLGIDVAQPRLSWLMKSDQRGDRQTAYQVLVASSKTKLDADAGDLWNTQRVESDQSTQLRYAGRPLQPHAECFWKVRAWDKDGKATKWSQPSRWSIGPLQPADWKAKWIGLDGEAFDNALKGTNWIWYPEGEPNKAVPTGARYFRRVFTLPADRVLERARFLFTADNECKAFVNGHEIGGRDTFEYVKDADITYRLLPGKNSIAVICRNHGNEPNPAGLVGLLRIDFKEGDPLIIQTDDEWKAFSDEAPDWNQREFDDTKWVASRKIGPVGMLPWGKVRGPEDRRLPARWLRNEFAIDKPIRRATVYFCGLGSSELYLNGNKVGDHVLSPAMTEYPKRSLYVTFDVTDMLQSGDNALGVMLGNGRFFSPRSSVFSKMPHYGFPKLLLHLRVEHSDGSISEILSDQSWKLTADGPILANNEYDGEEYDARKELGGWSTAGFDDSKWQPVQIVAPPGAKIAAQMIHPIRVTQTLKPKSVSEPRPGVFMFDMGQNMVGWCRLTVAGPAGTSVSLRHAEILQPDGTLYMANLRGAKVTDVYTLKGQGTEVWEPRFTYHGFRFVEVAGVVRGSPDPAQGAPEGLQSPVARSGDRPQHLPTLDSIEGRVVHDDVPSAGGFECSNPLVNQIYQNVVWGVKGNYRSVPTDCPQRDERQGWLGDRSEESKGEAYMFDIAAMYAKWLQDMEDSQKEDGSVSDVCPAHWPYYTDNVTWPSTTVTVPNMLHRQYGDEAIVARHYASAKKWVDHMLTFVKDGITDRDQYGDWCVPPEDPKLIHSLDPNRITNKSLLATSYLCHDLRLMERYATMLGKTEDATRFASLAFQMSAAFNAKFLNRDLGQYDNGTQTSCVLPLYFGLVPADMRSRIFDHLVQKISTESKNHIGTGLIGAQFLNQVLSNNGRADLSYTIASQQDYPSWGYMVSKDATTIWELWNGDTADPAMNSGNHVMLVGDLVIWLYEYVAGICPDDARPGFKHIIMRPNPVGDLTFARATHHSPYGLIKSDWRKNGDLFDWQIKVPTNSTATVFVPAANESNVTESGQPIAKTDEVKFLRIENGRAVFEIGSGTYHFESK